MSKGQSELVGLLVIVVLLIVFGVIYLRFSSLSGTSYEGARSSISLNNLLRALLAYNVQGYEFDAASYQCYQGDCDELQTAEAIVNASVSRQYAFWIEAEGKELYHRIGVCSTGIVASYPFTYEHVFFEAKLRMCE